MFHCDGWPFPGAVTAANATHVCLRKVDPAVMYPLIRDEGVTHMCGAPIVLTLLAHAPAAVKVKFPQTVDCATGGAAPPSAVIEAMEANGFRVIHLYGLTESYGPSTVRSEEHTSELQSLMRISYAVFCLKNTNHNTRNPHNIQ